MKRLLAAVILVLLVLATTIPSFAALTWCKSDPVVSLNGTSVQVVVSIPSDYVSRVTGPVNVTIRTPKGVTRTTTYTDGGYNGYGETVFYGDLTGKVNNGWFPTDITVSIPIDKTGLASGTTIPEIVDVIPSNSGTIEVQGNTDGTTVHTTILGSN